MIFIQQVVTGGLLALASVGGPPLCVLPKPVTVNIEPGAQEIKYDYARSIAEIQDVPLDTINPYGLHASTVTNGFMQGKISMKPEIRLGHAVTPDGAMACLWYDTITVSFDIDPTIVIAKEVAEDKCMHDAVLEHEKKHIDADRVIVNKYAQIMGQKIQDILSQSGVITERPVPAQHAQSVATRMQNAVVQVLEHEHQRMSLDRTEAQRAIDTKEEYERVRALCPNYKNK